MILDLKEFCQLFYSITFIPLTLYDAASDSVFYYPSVLQHLPFITFLRSSSLHFSKNPDYCLSSTDSFLGYIKSEHTEDFIIAGPIHDTPIDESNINRFLSEWAIKPESGKDISLFLKNIPNMSTYQFLQVLVLLHMLLNEEYLDINQHFYLEKQQTISKISSIHSRSLVNNKESGDLHNIYAFEQDLFHAVQNGNVEKVTNLLQYPPYSLFTGTVAHTPIRQEKNFFISLITLCTRYAISSGMDTEQAYQLSDIYIQECEALEDVASISNLQLTAVVDFTEQVARNKLPQGMSREVFECIQFISQNTNAQIQVSDVAAFIGKSRNHISAKFKKELGFDISKFIMRCKLEEAKSLLAYSDLSLSEISCYLCFSSQSYFQTVFKKQYGMTPLQYRNNHKK